MEFFCTVFFSLHVCAMFVRWPVKELFFVLFVIYNNNKIIALLLRYTAACSVRVFSLISSSMCPIVCVMCSGPVHYELKHGKSVILGLFASKGAIGVRENFKKR